MLDSNRGQTVMLAVLFSAIFFILGSLFFNFLQPDVRIAQAGLSCASPTSISDGTKLVCLIVDGVVPYFIILVLSTAGGIVMQRLTIG